MEQVQAHVIRHSITTVGAVEFEPVSGWLFKVPNFTQDFVAFESSFKGWEVVEFRSGATLCYGTTKEDAIKNASWKLAAWGYTQDDLTGIVESHIQSWGLSPSLKAGLERG